MASLIGSFRRGPVFGSRLAEAVEALCRDSVPETNPADPAEQSLAKAEKAMKSVVTELQLLQTMKLDDAKRLKLLIAVESCRDQLDLIHLSTRP